MMVVWSFFGGFVVYSIDRRVLYSIVYCEQYWRLHLRPHIRLFRWNESQEERFHNCDSISNVGSLSRNFVSGSYLIARFIFAIVFFLNFFLLTAGSSGAVPFGRFFLSLLTCTCIYVVAGTLLLIIILWFGISAPLSAVGSYFGSKSGVSDI